MTFTEGNNQTFSQQVIRPIMMGVFSSLLLFSILLSMFTPYPVGLSSIMYGRVKGFLVAAVGVGVSFLSLMFMGHKDPLIIGFLFLCVFIALGLAEIVHRNIHPMKGILFIGGTLSALCIGLVLFGNALSEVSLQDQIAAEIKKLQPMFEEQKKKLEASGESQPLEMEALMAEPTKMAQFIIEKAPAYFLVGIFVMLWFNLFLLLKSHRLIGGNKPLVYSEKSLLEYKLPDHLIWVLIGAVALTIWGDQLGTTYDVLGKTLFATIGVFYFFQGFGIYLAFLDFLRLTGFIRSFMVILTVFTAAQVLALVGVVDVFVDLKKLMKKKENKENE